MKKNVSTRLLLKNSEYKQKKKEQCMKCIKMGYNIADAMKYLHSLNIVYHDLKQDNIGFDATGKLKLFDFGLAEY